LPVVRAAFLSCCCRDAAHVRVSMALMSFYPLHEVIPLRQQRPVQFVYVFALVCVSVCIRACACVCVWICA